MKNKIAKILLAALGLVVVAAYAGGTGRSLGCDSGSNCDDGDNRIR